VLFVLHAHPYDWQSAHLVLIAFHDLLHTPDGYYGTTLFPKIHWIVKYFQVVHLNQVCSASALLFRTTGRCSYDVQVVRLDRFFHFSTGNTRYIIHDGPLHVRYQSRCDLSGVCVGLTTLPFALAASRTRSTTSSLYLRIPLSPFLTSIVSISAEVQYSARRHAY